MDVKHTVSPFEAQEFKEYYDNGGKEVLTRKLRFFDYSEKKGVKDFNAKMERRKYAYY